MGIYYKLLGSVPVCEAGRAHGVNAIQREFGTEVSAYGVWMRRGAEGQLEFSFHLSIHLALDDDARFHRFLARLSSVAAKPTVIHGWCHDVDPVSFYFGPPELEAETRSADASAKIEALLPSLDARARTRLLYALEASPPPKRGIADGKDRQDELGHGPAGGERRGRRGEQQTSPEEAGAGAD